MASLEKTRSKKPLELSTGKRVKMNLKKERGKKKKTQTFPWNVSTTCIFLLNDSELILPFGNVKSGKGN